jgi:cellulose synthase (UDP-forming)
MLYLNQINVNNPDHNNDRQPIINSLTKIDSFDSNHEKYTPSKSNESVYHSIFTNHQKILAYFIFVVWLLILVDFVIWWFTKTEARLGWAYWLNTITVFWLPILGLYFFYFSLRQKEIKIVDSIPSCKCAMIVSKIPSESEELLIRTLTCMLNQDFPYPYDVWIADENPTAKMQAWCKANGVNISTRLDAPEYHNDTFPRKAKTKEGNFAYFYDHFGYDNYDFISQFDADHAPDSHYLKEIIRHFADPKVGYVSAPSIIDANPEDSWTVIARSHWESTTHGPIQSGCNTGYAPMMFGSHYTHRVEALKHIGGIAPEFAEDHTTTMMYNSKGWKGAFARNAIAHGYGAVGLADSMLQEYQWALINIRVIFFVTPKLFWTLPFKVKLQFLIWQAWYPSVILVTLLSYFLPLLALKTQNSLVAVEGYGFLWHYLLLAFVFICYVMWLRMLQHLRPIFSWQVSWDTAIFQILQFPWIMLGCITGFYQVLTRSSNKLGITDKGEKVKGLNLFIFIPHFVIIMINVWAILSTSNAGEAYGYYWFAFAVIFSHVVSLIVGTILTISESFRFLNKNEKLNYLFKYKLTLMCLLVSVVFTFFSLSHIINNYNAFQN